LTAHVSRQHCGHSVHEWPLTKLPLEMRTNTNAAAVDAVVTTLDRLTMAVVILCITLFVPNHSFARDDGRFANSPLKEWFDRLASKNGLCCAFADGVSVQDVDWNSQEGNYRVRIYGQWFVVPDAAVVTEPNRFGPAVVWPYNDRYGNTQIRCFMPGAGT
jgi:hypothetical protein